MFAHHGHGKTVCQAIAFVGSGFVQGKSAVEEGSALRNNFDHRIVQDGLDCSDSKGADVDATVGQSIQKFRENGVGGNQPDLAERR